MNDKSAGRESSSVSRQKPRLLIFCLAALVVIITCLTGLLVHWRVQERKGQSLMAAVRRGDSTSVKQLLAAGADPDYRPVKARTSPLLRDRIWAFLSGQADRHRLGPTALMISAERADEVSVVVLVRAGAHIDTRDYEGLSALMHACSPKSEGGDIAQSTQQAQTLPVLNVIRTLLDAGADSNATAKDGSTALMRIAYWTERVDCAEALLKGGASLDTKDKLGTTALWHALNVGHGGMAKHLLSQGAQVDVYSQSPTQPPYESCLGQAIRLGEPDIVEEIIERGGKVHASGPAGPEAAIAFAAASGSPILDHLRRKYPTTNKIAKAEGDEAPSTTRPPASGRASLNISRHR